MPANGPADTLNYFVAGYIVIFVIMAIYLVSLALRRRSLTQDLETLEVIDQEKGKPEPAGFKARLETKDAPVQNGESRV
jgi:hypothetical protein